MKRVRSPGGADAAHKYAGQVIPSEARDSFPSLARLRRYEDHLRDIEYYRPNNPQLKRYYNRRLIELAKHTFRPHAVYTLGTPPPTTSKPRAYLALVDDTYYYLGKSATEINWRVFAGTPFYIPLEGSWKLQSTDVAPRDVTASAPLLVEYVEPSKHEAASYLMSWGTFARFTGTLTRIRPPPQSYSGGQSANSWRRWALQRQSHDHTYVPELPQEERVLIIDSHGLQLNHWHTALYGHGLSVAERDVILTALNPSSNTIERARYYKAQLPFSLNLPLARWRISFIVVLSDMPYESWARAPPPDLVRPALAARTKMGLVQNTKSLLYFYAAPRLERDLDDLLQNERDKRDMEETYGSYHQSMLAQEPDPVRTPTDEEEEQYESWVRDQWK